LTHYPQKTGKSNLLDIKIESLRGYKEFTRVITLGMKYEKKPVKAFVCTVFSEKRGIFTGFTAVKSIRKAVQRNRIKRLMREAFRLERENLIKRLDSRASIKIVFMFIGEKEIQPDKINFLSVRNAISFICSSIRVDRIL
jgi:ribonuclease P protein component